MKELCEDDRPREKMLRSGSVSLSNAELLAVLLRTGTGKMNAVDVARTLLTVAEGRLNAIADMSMEKMCSVGGIGKSKAVAIAAAFELGRRCAMEMMNELHRTEELLSKSLKELNNKGDLNNQTLDLLGKTLDAVKDLCEIKEKENPYISRKHSIC